MRISKTVIRLAWLAAALAFATAGAGLFLQGGDGTVAFTTVRGQTVDLYGQGLYRNDSLLIGAGFRGTDFITMIVAVPLLIIAALGYSRGSLRGGLMLIGMLAYFLYNSASMAFGAAYNSLFIAYIAMFSSSLFAFILAALAIDLRELSEHVTTQMPHLALSLFMLISGCVLCIVWLMDVMAALLANTVPPTLAHYTTAVTLTIDLGVIVPVLIMTGILLRKRSAFGYMLAPPMLVLCAMIGLVVAAQTLSQSIAGVKLSTGELVMFVGSFLVMAVIAAVLAFRFFRSISDTRNRQIYTAASIPNQHQNAASA